MPVAAVITQTLTPRAAALIEPFAISAHAVRRAAIAPGEQVLVVGAGPIGLGAAAIAKADGAQVVVADTSPARREHVATRLELPYWTRQPKILTRSYGRSLVVRWRRK